MKTSMQGGTDATRSRAVATTLVIRASTPLFGPWQPVELPRRDESADRCGTTACAERRGVRVVVAGATLEVVTTGGDDRASSREAVDTRTVFRRRDPVEPVGADIDRTCVEIETLIACHFGQQERSEAESDRVETSEGRGAGDSSHSLRVPCALVGRGATADTDSGLKQIIRLAASSRGPSP